MKSSPAHFSLFFLSSLLVFYSWAAPSHGPSGQDVPIGSSSSSSTYGEEHPWLLTLPLPVLPTPMTLFLRLQHESCSEFHGDSIQAISSPLSLLNCSNRIGALNAIFWHSSLDLPPHSIKGGPERVTSCPSSSSATLLHEFRPDNPCIARTIHAHLGHNFEFIARSRRPRWSSRGLLAPEDSTHRYLPPGHGGAFSCCCWTRRRRKHVIYITEDRRRSMLSTHSLQQAYQDFCYVSTQLYFNSIHYFRRPW